MAKLKDLEDLLVTALEGGSNYWYLIKEVPKGDPSTPTSVRIFDHLAKGGSIEIFDAEDSDESLGTLTLEKLNQGFDKMEADRGWDPDNFDAEDADVFLQYAVMGEIVFG